MAAKPKLTPEEWANARQVWENDPRDGYAWLVDELSLPVSVPAVRKRAAADGWMKSAEVKVSGGKVSRKRKPKEAAQEKPSGGLPKAGKTKPKRLEEIAPELAGSMNPKQRMFVEEFQKDADKTKAAARAGYSQRSAGQQAHVLMKNPIIQEAVALLQADRLDRMSTEADVIVTQLYAIATADPGEVTQYRRTCCRHCWGQDFGYQRTPAEYRAHVKAHNKVVAIAKAKGFPEPEFDEEGGFGYNGTSDPNPECPECFGEGVGNLYIADTRHLSPAGRLLFAGVEINQNGVKVNLNSQDKARDTLLRIMGLFQTVEQEADGGEIDTTALEAKFQERMDAARARQRRVLEERGLVIDGESVVDPE